MHSAIATLSRRGFRAEAMIETFLDYMTKARVVMPTMSWRAVTPEQPHWDEIETRFGNRDPQRDFPHPLCLAPQHSSDPFGRRSRYQGR